MIGAVGVAINGAGDAAEPAPAGGTRLVCENPSADFGEVAPTQAVKRTFSVQNQGTNDIRILNVRAGCGCVSTVLSTHLLGPGQKADLGVTLDLKGRHGPQRKALYVETDEPAFGRLRLEMTGTVVLPVEVQPEGVHFGTLGRDGDAEREVLLVGRTGTVFHVKAVKASSSQFAAQFEAREPERVYRVRIQSLGPRNLGTSHAVVQVATDHPALPEISIPVTVFVASEIAAAPATLMLVEGAGSATRTYYVGVFAPSGKAFKILAVRTPGDDLRCTVATVSPDRYRLEIKAPNALRELDGKVLRIETDMESMREVLVPVRVVAGPGEAVAR
jgi:hypothetical protein